MELVQDQAYDTLNTVTELENNQENILRELSRLRDCVVKLEFRVNFQEKQILDIKKPVLFKKIIINWRTVSGNRERRKSGKNIIIQNVLKKELEMDKESVWKMHIKAIYRMG